MNVLNLTPIQVAVGSALLIAILFGGLVLVMQLKGSADSPLHITLIPYDPDAVVLSSGLTPAAQSGVARLYAGYSGTPRTLAYEFLGSGGINFDVDWSSVRGNSVTFTTVSALDSWTNPGACAAPATQCGHLTLAVPSGGPPQAPDFYSIDGAAEEAVADDWVLEHGSLDLRGVDFHVIRTVAADIPTGTQVALRWLPWDGRGHLLPAP